MRKRTSEFLVFAESLGVAGAHITYGRKHPKLRGVFNGTEVNFAFAGSPSDHRSMSNARSALRRYLNTKTLII